MRIGLIAQLHGRPGGDLHPSWSSIKELATAAEDVGFDMFVFEDALLYRTAAATDGTWEAMAIAAGLAEATRRIRFGPSVINAPYRSAAMTASIATTLDEMSAGRFVLGIGAGNTEDYDYEAFGFPTDHRYSRFAEAIEIIHTLLRTGKVDYEGRFHSAKQSELVLRGPSSQGPPINIAAGGPKMLRLVAEYADAWNWWGYDEPVEEIINRLEPIVAELAAACTEVDRDLDTIERTIDLYSIVPPGFSYDGDAMARPVSGSAAEIANSILELDVLQIAEVRCDLTDKTRAAVEAMAPVVELVHDG